MSKTETGAFDQSLVRTVSESFREPRWLLEFRLASLADFASLPLETNPLYTKYASISKFDLSNFRVTTDDLHADFRSIFADFLTGKETNITLQGNEKQIHAELDAATAAKGVMLLPIRDAIESHGALVRRLFEQRLVKSTSDRLAAFGNAFFNCGTLVYVPKGVNLDRPLRKMLVLDSPRTSIIDQTFVYAEEQSKLVLLEELYSKGSPGPTLVSTTTELLVASGSHVDFSSLQLLDEHAVHVSNRAVQALNDSRATVSSLSLGAARVRSRMNFFLDGRGSVAEGFEIFFTDSTQKYDFETNLIHNSADSTGATQARGVLKGESQSIFKGMIKIVPQAKNSRSYLAHHSMILEPSAKSDAVPGLEIDNNEVKATHSASVAQIDEEQLFYLMARGLSSDEAKKMVVLGFFEPVLSRVPVEQTREGARLMIEGKWSGKRRRLVDDEMFLAETGERAHEAKPTENIFERHYKYR